MLGKLKELDISCNSIRALPDSITMLNRYRSFDLNVKVNIDVVQIASQIIHMFRPTTPPPITLPPHHPTSLEDLNARKNFLAALPVGLCHLQCLRKLDVAHNPLNEMPDSWHKQVPSPSYLIFVLALTSIPAPKRTELNLKLKP